MNEINGALIWYLETLSTKVQINCVGVGWTIQMSRNQDEVHNTEEKTKYRELERRCGSWVNLYSKAEDNQSLCPVCICPGGASSPDDHWFAINHHIMHLRIEQHQAITINDVPLIGQRGSLLQCYLLATLPVARTFHALSMSFRFGINNMAFVLFRHQQQRRPPIKSSAATRTSSHARVTSVKSQQHHWWTDWLSDGQYKTMIGLRSDNFVIKDHCISHNLHMTLPLFEIFFVQFPSNNILVPLKSASCL